MVKPLIVLRAIFDETRKRKKVKNKKKQENGENAGTYHFSTES